jgi:LmbE family N-acetylglucosaminyl deacetylase
MFLPSTPTILAISAHADDAEIGAAGLINRLCLEFNASLHMAIMTCGFRRKVRPKIVKQEPRAKEALVASLILQHRLASEVDRLPSAATKKLLNGSEDNGVLDPCISALLQRAASLVRDRRELKDALKRVHFGGFRDQRMHLAGHAAIEFIEHLVRDLRPDLVVTHSADDLHSDHHHVFLASMSALRDYRGTVLCYQTPSTVPNKFRPTFFAELDRNSMLVKILSILAHASQRERGMRFVSPSYVCSLAQAWHRFYRHTCGWLEAFETSREFWTAVGPARKCTL